MSKKRQTITVKLPSDFQFHPFQQTAVEKYASKFALHSVTGNHVLMASPTGTGKSYMNIGIHAGMFPHSWMLIPSVEIIYDTLCKMQVFKPKQKVTIKEVVDTALVRNITTPIRFHRMLLAGEFREEPRLIIKDEAHHDEANTYKQIDTMLTETVNHLGATATPYRGTPKSTAELLARWGMPEWAITYKDAAKYGYIAIPKCETWGLVNDDILELGANGEFQISKLTAEVGNALEHALDKSIDAGLWQRDGKPARPTLIGIPSSGIIPMLKREAEVANVRLQYVTAETPHSERQRLFAGCLDCRWALVHINVVGEGVDMAIRQYLDLSPCMSPMQFIQRFGRATRPIKSGEDWPRYICTNRNLERHGYILDGCLPPIVITEAQRAFDKPSERINVRAFGIESLGRLKPATVYLKNGMRILAYNVVSMDGFRKSQYMVVLHPVYAKPLWFKRGTGKILEGEQAGFYDYSKSKWEVCREPPADIQGFKSSPSKAPTDNQLKWWNKPTGAEKHGLLKEQEVTSKVFDLLPVLSDIGMKLA